MDEISDDVLSQIPLDFPNLSDIGNFNHCFAETRIPKKTRLVNSWAKNIWTQWANSQNCHLETSEDPHCLVPLDISRTPLNELDYWLSRFIIEVRRTDGKPYTPQTLQRIASGMQRYLRDECGRAEIVLFRKEDTHFQSFRLAFDSRIKELTFNQKWKENHF